VGDFNTSAGLGPRWPRVWRDYWRFIRAPEIPPALEPFSGRVLRDVALLLALQFIVVLVLLIADAALSAAGAQLPESKVEFRSTAEVVIAVLLAPALEETIFRGWLRGRQLHLAICVSLVLLILLSELAKLVFGKFDGSVFIGVIAVWALWTAFDVVISWKKRANVPLFYRRFFPAAFWFSCIAFAFGHLFNFIGDMRPLFIWMVLPQFVGGTIFAFARLRYGMWANISLHTAYNAAIVGAAVALG